MTQFEEVEPVSAEVAADWPVFFLPPLPSSPLKSIGSEACLLLGAHPHGGEGGGGPRGGGAPTVTLGVAGGEGGVEVGEELPHHHLPHLLHSHTHRRTSAPSPPVAWYNMELQ